MSLTISTILNVLCSDAMKLNIVLILLNCFWVTKALAKQLQAWNSQRYFQLQVNQNGNQIENVP